MSRCYFRQKASEKHSVAFASPDPQRDAAFWGQVLGRSVDYDEAGIVLPGRSRQIAIHFAAGAAQGNATNRLHFICRALSEHGVTIAGPFRTFGQLELATLDCEHWFNQSRVHSSIAYLTPIEVEEPCRQMNPRQQPLMEELASTKPGAIQNAGEPYSGMGGAPIVGGGYINVASSRARSSNASWSSPTKVIDPPPSLTPTTW